MRIAVSKKFSQIRILTNFMPIFTLKKKKKHSLDKTRLSTIGHMYKYVSVCAFLQWHVHVCCVCAHLYGFNLKDNFCITFELPSLFYVIFILIFSFSFSEKTPVKSGNFSKILFLPSQLK